VGDGKRASPQRAPEEPPDWLDVSEAVGLDAEKRARQRQEEQPRGTESHLRAVEAGRAPRVDSLLRRMVELGGSDLHLSSTNPPMLRLHGSLVPLGEGPSAFPPDALREQLYAILPERLRGEFESTSDVDFAYAVAGVARFRVNCFLDHKGIGAAFRQIPLEILSPAQLGLPRQVLNLCQPGKGLVLVAGPTGSGKSTTLASLVNHINATHDLHIITIEDPIEFVHANKQCLINQREVGVHTLSFARALRAALREDPDVVLVGELQDPETVAIALETAETGHLVLGALRTASAASTVDRILDQFPADRQVRIRTMLCDTLRGVVAQALCRRKGGGRVAAFEVLMSTPAVASLIREGNTQQIPSTMQAGKELGMQLLNDHLVELVRAGTVEPREACLLSYDRATIRAALSRLGLSI
jgi:twitching motility protein PilT